jgi:hypothetical protein
MLDVFASTHDFYDTSATFRGHALNKQWDRHACADDCACIWCVFDIGSSSLRNPPNISRIYTAALR